MATASIGVKSFLHLTDPLIIPGQWICHWFDLSRQQFLLFRDKTFYLWAPCSIDPGPKEFYTDSSWPLKILYAKVSMDGKLLVVQISKSSMIVVDTTTRKRWKVDIKYLSGNEILENGLVWSEHGGNSQDLVIVTSRGLELYKVSSARGQCKLSRYVSVKIHFFWYEPNFRTILTAVTSQGFTLDMSGFFLRFDMSDMPRLELPPPDRMPALVLDTGAGPDDIALVTLYGALYCIVRYEEQGGDTLCVYHLSRNKVAKVHTFPLYVSSPVRISVTDNILCCHCLSSNMSFLFDIKIPAGENDDAAYGVRGRVVDCSVGACTMSVEVSSSSSLQPRKNSLSVVSAISSSSSHIASANIATHGSKDEISNEGEGLAAVTFPPTAITPAPLPRVNSSTSWAAAEWSDAVGVGGETDMDIIPDESAGCGLSVSYSGRSRHHTSSAVSPAMSTRKCNRPLVASSASSLSSTSQLPPQSTTRYPEPLVPMRSLPTPPPRVSEGSASLSSTLRHAVEPYSGQWQVLAPYWVWDESTKCLWKMKCQLAAVVASMNEPRRVVGFLSRRGNAVEAPRPAFYSDFEDSYDAKKLLLRKMMSSLEEGISSSSSEALFEEIVANYALEYHRRDRYLRPRRDDSSESSARTARNSFTDESMLTESNSPVTSDGVNAVAGACEGTAGEEPMAGKGIFSSFRRLAGDTPSADTTTPMAKPIPKKFNVLGSLSLTRGSSSSGAHVSQHSDCNPGETSNLYLDSSPKRRASMNTQMIAAAHAARLSEYRAQQARAAVDMGRSSQVGPLEPVLAVDVFFPDILSIGSRAFGNRPQDRSVPASAPPPVNVCRNQLSCLLCTQTEILSYVLLPIALRLVQAETGDHADNSLEHDPPSCTIDFIISNLLLYFATLRTHDISINLSMSLLLINLLTFQKRFLDISHYVQLQFLSDMPELGMATLDISDSLEDELRILAAQPVDSSHCEFALLPNPMRHRACRPTQKLEVRRDLMYAVSSMRQAGVDMLWRLNEKSAVVRWMLSHGRVSDAMILCTKTKGQWKSGLSPMGISGLDFFRAAMSELCYLQESGLLQSSLYVPLPEATGRQKTSWKTSRFSRCNRSRSQAKIADLESFSTEMRGVQLMHAVYHFLNTWDPSLLTVQKLTGKSRLASMAHFPDSVFSNSHSSALKELFGF